MAPGYPAGQRAAAGASVTHSSNNRGIYAGGEVMKPVSVYDMCTGIIM